MLQVVVDFSTVDSGGKLTPCLALHVKGLGTDVVMHPWDLSASASLSSLAIVEKIHGTGGGPLYLVQTPVGAELLSVKFVMVKYLILWGLLHVFKTQFWPVCITCGVGHRWPLTRFWLCYKLRENNPGFTLVKPSRKNRGAQCILGL